MGSFAILNQGQNSQKRRASTCVDLLDLVQVRGSRYVAHMKNKLTGYLAEPHSFTVEAILIDSTLIFIHLPGNPVGFVIVTTSQPL